MRRCKSRHQPAWRIPLDHRGVTTLARQIPSPNCDARPANGGVILLVVHGISLPPGQFGGDGIERLFTNRLNPHAHPYYAGIVDQRVSAHFLIRRDGTLVQFVACSERAWHAGVSQWHGRASCNDYSIGIELEGTDDTVYTKTQYRMLARLVRSLRARYPIEAIAGHSDVAPGRKTDPGSAFEWWRLRRLLEGLEVELPDPGAHSGSRP